jgi:hypothetical protein
LIEPLEAARRLRWSRILEWYGLEPASGEASSRDPSSSRNADLERPIVALDEVSTRAAEVYAAATGRPFYRVDGVDALPCEGALAHAHSVLLVGSPRHFTARALTRMSSLWSAPWGFVTGADEAALSFMIAKLIASPSRAAGRRGAAVVDELHKTVRVAEPGGDMGPEESFSAERVSGVLRHPGWDLLVVHAHGEGSHANLRGVVLCGMIGDGERDPDGEPVDGCRIVAGRRVCKRVHSADIDIVSFSDIPVERLCFFSCNGLSVAGELYPSDVSCVLALAEGYPASVLCEDRSIPVSAPEIRAATRLLSRGFGLGELQRLGNDFQMYWQDARPYFVLGDPAGRDPAWTTPDEAGHFDVKDAAAPLDLRASGRDLHAARGVVRIEPDADVVDAWRGVERALVLLRADIEVDQAPASFRVVDAQRLWSEGWEWLVSRAQAALRCASLEGAVRHTYAGALESSADFASALTRLEEVRAQLDAALRATLQEFERARRRGIYETRLPTHLRLCGLLIAYWDRAFAAIASRYLVSGSVESLFTEGYRESARRAGEPCSRCGTPLSTMRAEPFLGLGPARLSSLCALCGPREAWTEGGPRLYVDLPPRVEAGRSLEIPVRLEDARVKSAAGDGYGYLVISIKDKGRGRVIFDFFEKVDRGELVVRVDFPPDTTSDLHTLRAVWVHEIEPAYLRLRCAAVRPAS